MDSNILIYVQREESPKYRAAKKRLESLAEGSEPWAVPVFTLGESLRVLTHPRFFNPPTPLEEALENLAIILQSPSVRLLCPGDRYWFFFRQTLKQAGARGNLIFDAQIAALCREHGVDKILTEDRDFNRFEGIHTLRLDEIER